MPSQVNPGPFRGRHGAGRPVRGDRPADLAGLCYRIPLPLTFTYDDARVWARVRACAHVCVSSCNFGGHTSQPLRRASFPTLTMRMCIKYLWTFRQKYNVTLLKRLSFIMIHVCLKDFRHQLFRKANKWEGCSKDSE